MFNFERHSNVKFQVGSGRILPYQVQRSDPKSKMRKERGSTGGSGSGSDQVLRKTALKHYRPAVLNKTYFLLTGLNVSTFQVFLKHKFLFFKNKLLQKRNRFTSQHRPTYKDNKCTSNLTLYNHKKLIHGTYWIPVLQRHVYVTAV